jgi:hypothetical protein
MKSDHLPAWQIGLLPDRNVKRPRGAAGFRCGWVLPGNAFANTIQHSRHECFGYQRVSMKGIKAVPRCGQRVATILAIRVVSGSDYINSIVMVQERNIATWRRCCRAEVAERCI